MLEFLIDHLSRLLLISNIEVTMIISRLYPDYILRNKNQRKIKFSQNIKTFKSNSPSDLGKIRIILTQLFVDIFESKKTFPKTPFIVRVTKEDSQRKTEWKKSNIMKINLGNYRNIKNNLTKIFYKTVYEGKYKYCNYNTINKMNKQPVCF